jgi:hypothetical protein
MNDFPHNRMATKARRQVSCIALAMALALCAVTASAQTPGSVEDFRLPPQPSPAPAPVEGPVDADNPVARPTVNPPQPQPAVSPTPTAPVASPIPTADATRGSRSAPRERPVTPQATLAPTSTAISPATPTEALSTPSAIPEATSPAMETSLPPSGDTGGSWTWIAALAALLLAGLGVIAWKRRGTATKEMDAEIAGEEAPPFPEPALFEIPPAPAEPLPMPSPVTLPPVALTADTGQSSLEAHFAAQSLTCSLVFASLAYRLELSNRGDTPKGPFRIAGDVTSAHASLSTGDQLSPDGAAMPAIHRVEPLAPGESATVTGQLRMAMADIVPVRQGQTALFVPLARFHIADEGEGDVSTTRVFVVGEAGEAPDGGLRPFRLDRMPGVVRGLDQRDVSPAG